MKLNNLLLVSIFLLALITLGAVSAADDNAASVTAVEGDLNLEVPANDEIDAGGDVDSDAAISDNVNDVEDFIYYITTLSNEQSKDNGISYLYGFMYNFIKPFVNIEGLDWSPAYTIVSVFPIPLIIGLWYLYKNNKHYEFMFPVIISIVITTILAVMGNRMPHIVNMFLGAELVSLSSIIFATGLLGLYMIFYLMSNSDEKLFSLKQAIWITMACLIFSAIVPLPTAIADRNWRTLFTVPYVILTFLMLNYNKDKKYQRWFVWSLAIITILETSVYLISGF